MGFPAGQALEARHLTDFYWLWLAFVLPVPGCPEGRQQSLGRTWLRRPDLLDETTLSKADRALLAAFRAARGGQDES